ncbi:hypothetical protein ACF05W_32440 [Streptomyces lydicus]|uniref:hypothetical protein n=1 Tax=Streptomyces lydicus TaxID=47763 RepID=UPI0036F4BE5C
MPILTIPSEAFGRFQYPTSPLAVFAEDVVGHYQRYLDHRRSHRPEGEYGDVTPEEWAEFEDHFDKRKIELGNCARPYGTPRRHEHACMRCPVLQVNPKMLPRLAEIEKDLILRRKRAGEEKYEITPGRGPPLADARTRRQADGSPSK